MRIEVKRTGLAPRTQWNDAAHYFFRRLPPAVASSFTPEQVRAIHGAFAATNHLVDIRPTIGLLGSRFYLVFQIGRERRSAARVAAERAQRPFWTAGNLLTLLIFFTFLALSIIGAMTFASAAVQLNSGL